MIEEYSHEKHYERLCRWLEDKMIPRPDKKFFSDLGFCVDDCAIGFLHTGLNSNTCEIDHVAADPNVSVDKRDFALNVLFRKLEHVAKERGFLIIKALAELPTMRNRFDDHGYRRHGEMTLFYKRLDRG